MGCGQAVLALTQRNQVIVDLCCLTQDLCDPIDCIAFGAGNKPTFIQRQLVKDLKIGDCTTYWLSPIFGATSEKKRQE